VYTPYVSVLFSIEEDEIKSDGIDDDDVTPSVSSLYEVSITMGSDKNMSELTVVCIAGEEHEILFDMSEFSDISMASYIKVSMRKLGDIEDGKGYSFYLSSIKGYSDVYSSGELSGLIADERLRIRDMYDDSVESEPSEKSTWMLMMGAGLTVIVIAIGVFMCFRREDDAHTDRE
jgi:hypothetical protein